jgi:hypothetical protein
MENNVVQSTQLLFQMKQYCNTMRAFRNKVAEANELFLQNDVHTLCASVQKLEIVINDMEKTNEMLHGFICGNVSLADLERWRDTIAERISSNA